MTVTGDDSLVGRVLDGRYIIGSRIARGGMASVYLATDDRLDRDVAVKIMHHGLSDDQQFSDRFVREAKSAAKLNHPNVVSVFDQGKDGDVAYLVMELVPGHTLRDVMRAESPMKPDRALEIVEQVLVALSAAHAAHIIHRDVKPENVLMTPDGEVKVADFGLARAVSAATTATGGTLIGTVSYLAPEIVLHVGADARSDVYAVGAMLYEMLTGAKPHVGDSPIQVAYKHVHDDVPAPSALNSAVPPYLDALVARATVRDRDQRSTDARVMLHQLRLVRRALVAGVPDDDLTADLLPRPGIIDPDDDRDDTIAVPMPVTGGSATAPVEHTVEWSAETAPVDTSRPVETTAVAGTAVAGTATAGRAPRTNGLHPPVSPEDYRAMRADRPRSRRGRRLLITALILALLAALLGWYVADGRYTSAPVLVGSQEGEASTSAEQAGFTFEVAGRQFSETVPAGVVISTDPGPGDKVLPDSNIEAVVSKGKDRVTLPDKVRGLTVDELRTQLADVDLELGEVTERFADTVPEGQVVDAVNVKADEPLKRGTRIDITVSKGREPIAITDFTGRDIGEARSAVEQAGFTSIVEEEFSDDVDKDKIISQSPDGGNGFKGDAITFVISKGPDVVEVPDVTGQKKNEAVKSLEKAGFKVRNPFPGNFTVEGQSPDGGEKVKRGSTVTISFF
ncbi:Stk1 family PASTA domain-containing Ser/Thr kinase [Aeromicrobium sp. CF3.5]|uniref:Stk1 family PASTA domain-containing Ser/Thr kinase n=1 Tax=Aeromicrobium sp. CF3.5 TaxID=3373078 RepID=UPI003EE60E00